MGQENDPSRRHRIRLEERLENSIKAKNRSNILQNYMTGKCLEEVSPWKR
jgi:hypothetical protein